VLGWLTVSLVPLRVDTCAKLSSDDVPDGTHYLGLAGALQYYSHSI
jgi:hypothetical protein